jgi:lysophospholipase L1-like esterase
MGLLPRAAKNRRNRAVVWCCVVIAGLFTVYSLGYGHFLGFREGDSTYVAIGSSFAAGPGVGDRARGSILLCERSDANYAHRLAPRIGLTLRDVTCSGATTDNVLRVGQYFQPGQVNAVQPQTKLVTITIGGNDVGYLAALTAGACASDPSDVPFLVRLIGVCRALSEAVIAEGFAALPSQLTAIAAAVHSRAPAARIVFVDYATVLPESGTCARLHLTDRQAQRGREIAERLRDVMTEAAHMSHSAIVHASDITRGHDVCSPDPWVFGFEFPAHFPFFGPAPFHPKSQAMQAVADAIRQQLADRANSDGQGMIQASFGALR